jgi:hypothetical protein
LLLARSPLSRFGLNIIDLTEVVDILVSPYYYCYFTIAIMRLTAELVQSSLSYLNPLKERELDLRGAYLPKRT